MAQARSNLSAVALPMLGKEDTLEGFSEEL
jgi:hypothetical protein